MQDKGDTQQWVSMKEAAERVGVHPSKISRLASKGEIRTKRNPRDEREKLVNLSDVETYFSEDTEE